MTLAEMTTNSAPSYRPHMGYTAAQVVELLGLSTRQNAAKVLKLIPYCTPFGQNRLYHDECVHLWMGWLEERREKIQRGEWTRRCPLHKGEHIRLEEEAPRMVYERAIQQGYQLN